MVTLMNCRGKNNRNQSNICLMFKGINQFFQNFLIDFFPGSFVKHFTRSSIIDPSESPGSMLTDEGFRLIVHDSLQISDTFWLKRVSNGDSNIPQVTAPACSTDRASFEFSFEFLWCKQNLFVEVGKNVLFIDR